MRINVKFSLLCTSNESCRNIIESGVHIVLISFTSLDENPLSIFYINRLDVVVFLRRDFTDLSVKLAAPIFAVDRTEMRGS